MSEKDLGEMFTKLSGKKISWNKTQRRILGEILGNIPKINHRCIPEAFSVIILEWALWSFSTEIFKEFRKESLAEC